MPRHLRSMHGDEPEVRAAEDTTISNSERLMKNKILKNKGNYYHNVQVKKKKTGDLITLRRPTTNTSYHKFAPCPFCLAYVVRSELNRHSKTCNMRDHQSRSNIKQKSAKMEMDESLTPELASVLSHLRHSYKGEPDKVSEIIKNDPLVLEVGQTLLNKENKTQDVDHVRERMRECGRLLKQLRTKPGNEDRDLKSFIRPSEFDFFCASIKALCDEDGKFTLAAKLGYDIVKFTDIVWCEYIKDGDVQGQNDAKNFHKLYRKQYGSKISCRALKNMYDKKLNKKFEIPKTKDCVKLSKYLKKSVDDGIIALQKTVNPTNWRALESATMVSIILFNRKRGGEVSRMKTKNYEDAKLNRNDVKNQEIFLHLPAFQKKLAERHLICKIKGIYQYQYHCPTCHCPTCHCPTCHCPTCHFPTCGFPTCSFPTCGFPSCCFLSDLLLNDLSLHNLSLYNLLLYDLSFTNLSLFDLLLSDLSLSDLSLSDLLLSDLLLSDLLFSNLWLSNFAIQLVAFQLFAYLSFSNLLFTCCFSIFNLSNQL
jgi:hypothetical protein